jgi:hypothetical protein
VVTEARRVGERFADIALSTIACIASCINWAGSSLVSTEQARTPGQVPITVRVNRTPCPLIHSPDLGVTDTHHSSNDEDSEEFAAAYEAPSARLEWAGRREFKVDAHASMNSLAVR